MFCKEYEFIKWQEVSDEQCPVVWVEVYADTTPSPFPTNAEDIDNFPLSYDASKVIFAPGSILYVIDSGDIYMADSTGSFIQQ